MQLQAAVFIFTRHHLGLRHAGLLLQHPRHFRRFYPVAANLNLVVHPAQKRQRAIFQHLHPIARAIQPLARVKRTADKALRRVRGAGLVAPCDLKAAQAEFAGNPYGSRIEIEV